MRFSYLSAVVLVAYAEIFSVAGDDALKEDEEDYPWRILDRIDEIHDDVDWPEWIADQEDDHEDLTLSGFESWHILRNESTARPPIVLLPGMASSRLVNWREKHCAFLNSIRPKDVVWLNLGKLVETRTFDPKCWLECMKLDPGGKDLSVNISVPSRTEKRPKSQCALRPAEGLDAVSVLAPGVVSGRLSRVFEPLIDLLVSHLRYEGGRSLFGIGYDWRLSPRRMQERDGTFSKLKAVIERAVELNQRPAVIMAHSMGNLMVGYFVDWLYKKIGSRAEWRAWIGRHIFSYVALGAPLLGAAGALKPSVSGETFGLQLTEEQARSMELTFDSTHWLNPRRTTSRRHRLTRGNWPKDLIRIRPHSRSNRTVAFGIDDVANGGLFRWLKQDAMKMDSIDEELRLAIGNKHSALRREFWEDPVGNPMKGPVQRFR
uniref:Phospholipid:diacylglycerol acyltransferase n=1 Tax=Octactis speculum TaxID=3111310 RepID=A0A7S2D1D4_9STRA|mmetsp:Transcript_42233/g.57637  ORF Transcript_42233/g.57637 Transcript_42233/m.57637 type:complete len:432 (+) Transcript_42233:124-1419(+)